MASRILGALLLGWGGTATAVKCGAQSLQAVATPPLAEFAPLPPGDPSEALRSLFAGPSGLIQPGILPPPATRPDLPRVFAPTRPRATRHRYPWKRDIVATVFWVGELPTPGNPVPNTVSAWDKRWTANYGGYDDPDPESRERFLPKEFVPGQNPFYFALPYNDLSKSGTKASARAIPWFDDTFYRDGRTVLKGRWIAIRAGGKECYAQWEDVGPFETDDWDYVFGEARPKTKGNQGAGLDVSPAVRDYLASDGRFGLVDWRFVDVDEVPEGPWTVYGQNNPFANEALAGDALAQAAEPVRQARQLRDRILASIDAAGEGAD